MAEMTLSLGQIAAMGGSYETLGTPRVILPADISAVVGDTLQVFMRGIVEMEDPYVAPVKVACTVGKAYPRYFEWTPESGDAGTTKTVTVSVMSTDETVVATAATNIITKTASDPASLTTVMCLGDSVTNGMAWPQETYRRLTQSGGTPAGHGFSNFDFVGEQAFPDFASQGGFGRSGWTWTLWAGDTSPFWIGGELDIEAWFDANNSGVGPDVAVIHLGWNGLADSASAVGHADTVTAAKVFVDKLHAQFPSCKVVVIGLQAPPHNGAMSAQGAGYRSNYYEEMRHANGLNLAYAAWAAEPGYSSWLRYASLAAQFDADYNYNDEVVAKPVNARSSTTEIIGTNHIHPGSDGKMQIADVAYREIVRVLA